jgi:hypothetical protein
MQSLPELFEDHVARFQEALKSCEDNMLRHVRENAVPGIALKWREASLNICLTMRCPCLEPFDGDMFVEELNVAGYILFSTSDIFFRKESFYGEMFHSVHMLFAYVSCKYIST